MPTFDVTYTNVFWKTRSSNKPLIINVGGTGSSKSYSLTQLFVLDRLFSCHKRKMLIVRKTLPSLKKSTYEEALGIIQDMALESFISINKTDMVWEYKPNRNKIFWGSLDDAGKWKSTAFNDIWMEEGMDYEYHDYQVLSLYNRAPATDGLPNQFYISENPVDEFHWTKTQIIDQLPKDSFELIHSTYNDNPYYPEDKKKQLELIALTDPNFYRIYKLGEWGILEGLIYTNYDIVSEFPTEGNFYMGLDFGFNDPTVLVEHCEKDREIWERELFYESGYTNADFIKWLNANEIDKNIPIYADSEDPNRIEEIRREGYNIIPAKKGKDSVLSGINFCKKFKYHIHENSVNIKRENKSYCWQVKNGKLLDIPNQSNDHSMDARRYADVGHLNRQETKVWFA